MIVCLIRLLVYSFVRLFICILNGRCLSTDSADHGAGLSHVDLVLTDECLVFT